MSKAHFKNRVTLVIAYSHDQVDTVSIKLKFLIEGMFAKNAGGFGLGLHYLIA